MVLSDWDQNPQSTTLEAGTLTSVTTTCVVIYSIAGRGQSNITKIFHRGGVETISKTELQHNKARSIFKITGDRYNADIIT